jgi:DNA polymerase
MELDMSDLPRPTPEELARQARQHLDSLRAAGVEWLPTAPQPETPAASVVPTDAAPATAPALFGSLFDATPVSPTGQGEAGVAISGQPGLALTLAERRQALDVLAQRVAACTRCAELVSTRTQTVLGDGQPGVELCFIGEAPGAEEDAQGKPFVGPAGQLLNRIISACGMKREEVYICNIIKCRPPGNRTPLPNEAANCREYLDRQLELVQPKFICALGGCAAQNLLNTSLSLGKLRGRFHNYRGIPVLCTYHPAYLLPHRSPGSKKEVWEDMKMLMAKMGRPVK